jgi:hypothetical protein
VLGFVFGIDRRQVSISIDWQDDGPRLYGLERRLKVTLLERVIADVPLLSCPQLRKQVLASQHWKNGSQKYWTNCSWSFAAKAL